VTWCVCADFALMVTSAHAEANRPCLSHVTIDHTQVDGVLTPTVTSRPTSGLRNGATFPEGTTTVTYTASDRAGNSAACTFTVAVPVGALGPWSGAGNTGPHFRC
jgi:hypothetical protein